MSFQPVIPFTGYTGWTFLKRTMEKQQAALQSTTANQREEAYFRANIGKVTTAQQLVDDRRLLKVALTAFGLEADLNAKAFVRKVLTDGTEAETALANRMADKRYRALAMAFNFTDPANISTQMAGFADKVLATWRTKSFEAAVGDQNNAMRLALNAEREVGALAKATLGEDTKWFTVMGNTPLRKVFETALGLPAAFGQLDIDQQLKVFKTRAQVVFGAQTVSQFTDPDKLTKLVRIYLVRDEVANGTAGASPMQNALTLLAR